MDGGDQTLRALVAEARANKNAMKAKVRTVLESSYSNYYRRMLPQVLSSMDFRCNNTAYRPVMDALDLLRRYADRPKEPYAAEVIPIEGVVPADWRAAIYNKHGKVIRTSYELCVLSALSAAIRRREVWVDGAGKWRDPEADLPRDFDVARDMHYAEITQPTDPTVFTDTVRARLETALTGLAAGLRDGTTGGVRITSRRNQVWISVPRLTALPEPPTLAALKAELVRRWGVVDLLDIAKEAVWLTGCDRLYSSVTLGLVTPTQARGLDTSDDMCGELIFTVFAAIAKFQRQQIVKGTREGLDAARARGRVGGCPRALNPEQTTDARILLDAGQTRTAVAAKLRVARWTLSRALDTVPH